MKRWKDEIGDDVRAGALVWQDRKSEYGATSELGGQNLEATACVRTASSISSWDGRFRASNCVPWSLTMILNCWSSSVCVSICFSVSIFRLLTDSALTWSLVRFMLNSVSSSFKGCPDRFSEARRGLFKDRAVFGGKAAARGYYEIVSKCIV